MLHSSPNNLSVFSSPQEQAIDRILVAITVMVVALHIALLISSAFIESQNFPKFKEIKEHLVVRTVNLKEESKQISAPKQIVTIDEPPILPKPLPAIAEPIPSPPVSEPIVIETPKPPPAIEEPKAIEAPKEEPLPTPPPPSPSTLPQPPPRPSPSPPKPSIKTPPKPNITPKKQPLPPKPVKKAEIKKTEVKKSVPKEATSKKIPPKAQPKKTEAKKPAKESPPKQEKNSKTEQKSQPSVPKVDPKAEAAKARRRELLASAEKSIAKIERSRDTLSTLRGSSTAAAAIPGQIEALHVETLPNEEAEKLTPHERSYYDELANRLKLLLRLPEFGEVKIKLTLERSGHFVKVSIMSSKSQANKNYIEKTLPTIKYPSFGDNFGIQDQYTFVIVLSNDM